VVQIVWTAEALTWLREIHNHVASENVAAAARVVAGITARVEQLKAFPDSGARIATPVASDIRMLLYRHYRIVYRRAEEERIEIIGVYHGALAWRAA